MTVFKSLHLSNWRQYNEVQIDFHPRLTLITGANGSGKTTILNLLNRHFGWNTSMISTLKNVGYVHPLFFPGLSPKLLPNHLDYAIGQNVAPSVGEILYTNNAHADILVDAYSKSPIYEPNIIPMNNVKGLHIPSHRPVYRHEGIGSIHTTVASKITAFNSYNHVLKSRFTNSRFGSSGRSENTEIKSALISLATLGFGNEMVERNEEAVKTFEGFQDILKLVLPHKLGFERLTVRMPEIVMITKSGEFSFDAVSGGIASIIDMAWLIFTLDHDHRNFVVTIDEPENHLHPEMQKTLLPNFLKAFPKAQFIVVTHNPFIISSVPESNIYVLNYNELQKVESILLEDAEKSGTANDILKEVLGIETTMPDWVDTKIDSIIDRYAEKGITPENIQNFKTDLRSIGLDKYVPTSVVDLIEKSKAEHSS